MTPPSKTMVATFGTWLVDRVNVFFRVRRYLKMIARRWFVLAGCLMIGVGVAAYLALHTPNIYSASSKIGIAPKIQTAYNSQAQYLEEINNFYDSQLQYMTSSKVMEKVSEKLAESKPAGPDFSLVTRAVKGAGSFTMVVESTDFEYARRFAQTWANEFIHFKNRLRENAIGKSAASTREEIGRYEKSLEKARAALLTFQREHNLGSVKETGDAAQQRLDKMEGEYQDVKTLRQRLETKTPEEIASGVSVDPFRPAREGSTTPKPANAEAIDPVARFEGASKYSDLKLQLKTKQAEWDRQNAKLKPKHPFMVKLAQDLLQLDQDIHNQLDLIEEKRRARIKSLKDDEESYRPLVEDLRKQVLASRNVQYEFERLKEEETNVKTVLDNLRKSEESLNSTTADEGLFNLIEEGVGSPLPVRPNRRQMILAGLVLGLGVGLGFIYLLGRIDDRLELAEDIEGELEEVILGQIPQMNLKKMKQARLLITELDEHHMFSESLRGVRSAVILGGQTGTKQVLVMTSAVPGDGKTTVTVNFAATLAIAGHRVLLVDADLRRGETHNFFGHSREIGFSEILLGQLHWTDVVQQTEIKTLQVIHSGKLPHNPGELLISPITKEFISEVRKSYDYVLFDCPPLTAIDDTFSLVGLADGLLFIVRSGQTSMRFARNALMAVRQRGAPILGIILNGIHTDNPYYYYNNYYHAYYSQDQPKPLPLGVVPMPAVKMALPKRQQPLATGGEIPAAGAPVGPPQIIGLEQFQPSKGTEDSPPRRAGSASA